MSHAPDTAQFRASTRRWTGWRFILPLAAYVAFAAAVYLLQGDEPPLSIDHVSYFKLANDIRAQFPNGDYWRNINPVRAYGVILAFGLDWTGSHIRTLKLLLAIETVAYLGAFHLFMRLATESRWRAMLFAILSALFVSFGATMWGVTDFAASLSRTIIMPFVVLLTWFFFRFFESPWRYAVYPGLIVVSLLHLSAMHIFLLFAVFEGLDFAFRRRCRLDRDVAWFVAALLASAGVQAVIEVAGAGTGGYVRQVVSMAAPAPKPAAPAPKPAAPPAQAPATPAPPPSEPAVTAPPPPATPAPAVPRAPDKLGYAEAWSIEQLAFPWRNFPPSFATLATMASSFGLILLVALAGAIRAFKVGPVRALDGRMAMFAAAVPLAAFGLQATIWGLRQVIQIMPVNFEEIRLINMIMIPAVYFTYRLYELAPPLGRLPVPALRALIVLAFACQPILLVRTLPAEWREAIVAQAVSRGLIRPGDSLRMLYARQFLHLEDKGPRFYYSSRGAVQWLEANAAPADKVLTRLNEFHMSRVRAVGPFLEVMEITTWEPRRATWARTMQAVDAAMATHDIGKVQSLAREVGATFVVVDWPVPGADYHDEHYSVVRVPAAQRGAPA